MISSGLQSLTRSGSLQIGHGKVLERRSVLGTSPAQTGHFMCRILLAPGRRRGQASVSTLNTRRMGDRPDSRRCHLPGLAALVLVCVRPRRARRTEEIVSKARPALPRNRVIRSNVTVARPVVAGRGCLRRPPPPTVPGDGSPGLATVADILQPPESSHARIGGWAQKRPSDYGEHPELAASVLRRH